MGMHLERIHDWETLAREAGHQATALARLARVSVRQLERHFKQRCNATPRDWLIQTRLRHATELIRAGQTDKEVAAVVGFRAASSLCHFFKQTTGCTPQEYPETQTRRPEPARTHSFPNFELLEREMSPARMCTCKMSHLSNECRV